jgi:predicted transcriptional regulator YdeE
MISVLEDGGYSEFKVPPTKYADKLFSRRVSSDVPDVNFYIHAWYYNSDEHKGQSVTFEIRLDDEREADNIRVEVFGYSSLTPEKLEKVEERIVNIYTHMLYV